MKTSEMKTSRKMFYKGQFFGKIYSVIFVKLFRFFLIEVRKIFAGIFFDIFPIGGPIPNILDAYHDFYRNNDFLKQFLLGFQFL